MQPNAQLRHDGRCSDQLRSVWFSYNIFEYAAGSIFFELGKNKILCAVTMQNSVPSFLRGKNSGWLTAEYAMLPAATIVRTQRESQIRRNGRSIEISRFIGRALRAVVDVSVLGERTIIVDCDVLQADGGTRTTCITASYLALQCAQEKWLRSKIIEKPFLREGVVAVSVGILDGKVILDLDYVEDSAVEADFNFVITQSDAIVEIQGSVEKKPIVWDLFDSMRLLAVQGAKQLFAYFKKNNRSAVFLQEKYIKKAVLKDEKFALFSLKKRQLNV